MIVLLVFLFWPGTLGPKMVGFFLRSNTVLTYVQYICRYHNVVRVSKMTRIRRYREMGNISINR